MLINSQKLTGLRVQTESGDHLGSVHSFDLDIKTQSVRNYYIKAPLFKKGIFAEELKVHQGQVVNIDLEKMVVVDNVVKYKDVADNKVLFGKKAQVS